MTCTLRNRIAQLPFGRKTSHTVAIAALAVLFGHQSALAVDLVSLVRKAKPAVVQLRLYDENHELIKTGTGFFVTSDGVLVTNHHVVEGASYLEARTPSGAFYPFTGKHVQVGNLDIELLRLSVTDAPFLNTPLDIAPEEGEHVVVIGNPEGLEGTVTEGIVSAIREGGDLIQISAAVSPGSSGSPVMDDSGNVIGVATYVFKEGQNLGFALSNSAILRGLASMSTQSETENKHSLSAATPTATPAPNSAAPTSPQKLLIAVDRMIANHDWQGLTRFTVDGLTNYLGHRYASNTYIASDLQQDSRVYAWVKHTVDPETFTHEVSNEYSSHWNGPMLYDSINVYSEALEKSGKQHKATIRLTVGYVIDPSGHLLIYSITSKVL